MKHYPISFEYNWVKYIQIKFSLCQDHSNSLAFNHLNIEWQNKIQLCVKQQHGSLANLWMTEKAKPESYRKSITWCAQS